MADMLDTQTDDNNPTIELDTSTKRKPVGKSPEGIERAARMKAAIIALLNNSPEPMAKGEMEMKLGDVIKELNYKTSNFESQLYQLVANDLVKKAGKNPTNTGFLYASPRYEFPTPNVEQVTEQPRQKRTYTKRKGLENTNVEANTTGGGKVPSVSLDIVKSTGRVRLAINGMSIEIGVSDN